MNILIKKRIIFNMTYKEYKSKKKNSNKKHTNNFIKALLSKLFTIVIFSMLVVAISNYSDNFRSFLINDVFNKTMDFSKINKLVNNVTNVFKSEEVAPVMKENESCEKYLNGIKCINTGNVIVKDGGIVTFIGEKEGYNNTVIIQQSDGYYAWYGNIKESVKLYDYLESGSILGVSENEYYYVLLKDDKPIKITDES